MKKSKVRKHTKSAKIAIHSMAVMAAFLFGCGTFLQLHQTASALISDYPTPSMYFSPELEGGNYIKPGSVFQTNIRTNKVASGVGRVRIGFCYPTNILELESLDYSSSAFDTPVTGTVSGGVVHIERKSSLPSGISGDQNIATITFKAIGSLRDNATLDINCASAGNNNMFAAGSDNLIYGAVYGQHYYLWDRDLAIQLEGDGSSTPSASTKTVTQPTPTPKPGSVSQPAAPVQTALSAAPYNPDVTNIQINGKAASAGDVTIPGVKLPFLRTTCLAS